MGKLLIGVDLGTSFIKTGVFEENGNYLTGASEKVDEIRTPDGGYEQPGGMIYGKVCRCLSKTAAMLGEKAREVGAVGFAGQMAGSIGVGEDWEDVTTWSCTLDSRYTPFADRIRREHGDAMYRISGTSSPVMGAKYAWFREAFPERHKKIVKYTMLNGYVIGRLSGIPVEEAAMDYSLIAWTGLADLGKLGWSDELCGRLGVDPAHLPRIASGGSIAGRLGRGGAQAVGLPEGVPLVLGAGDKICGAAGAGSLAEGDTLIELASYAAVNCRAGAFRPDFEHARYDVIGGVAGDGFCAHKYLQGSGITTDWFLREFAEGLEKEGKRGAEDRVLFEEMERLAASVPPGSGSLMAIGLAGGSAIPFDRDARGAFLGFTWGHKKEHLYRALIESFTYDLTLSLRAIEKQYPEYAGRPVTLTGGGASSAIWPQILADVTGREMRVLNRKDTALLGAARIAGAGAGILPSLDAPFGGVRVEKTFVPEEGRGAIYGQYLAIYEELLQEMSGIMKKLSAVR